MKELTHCIGLRLAFLHVVSLGTIIAGYPAFCDVHYPDFSQTDGLTLVGSAGQDDYDSVLRLTPDVAYLAGAAWVNQKQSVVNHFDASFGFQITGENAEWGGADGLAFVVQNTSVDALGAIGNGIGFSGIGDGLGYWR